SAEEIPHKLSMRASVTGGLVLDAVRVPEGNRLPEASGLKAPLACLDNARFGVAWGVLGAAQACFEIALKYACEREQFGAPIALEAARRCRAVLGANGVAGDFHVLRHAANLESTFTYEGTDQIHTLAIGRALTGSAAV